jgi:DNA-binding SARP family transcriptional activator
LLGRLTVECDGAPIALSAALPRTLLAVLLLEMNTAVSADRLIEALWAGRPPASASASLHNHVMRLRRLLGQEGGERVRAAPGGYLIQVEPGELDVHAFTDLCVSGAAALRDRQWAKASDEFAAALAICRGEPLSDVPRMSVHEPRLQQWEEDRLQALEGRIEADLALGRHGIVISELRALTTQYPLREAFHAQLMLAFYRAHRQADALDAYQVLRRTLVADLGVEPDASVQQLHQRILRADPTLDRAEAPPVAQTPEGGARRVDPGRANGGGRQQLPAGTRAFTGRDRELAALTDFAGDSAPGGVAPVVCTIDGMAGIGKTCLAVHAARRLRERFPDGQLFLDLHGHTADVDPVEPGAALDYLLRSLGTLPQRIPREPGQRAAFYRDRLAGSRTLIVLDNAAGSAQIRPLLPGEPGCMVIVTSRRRLTGLDDAYSLALDPLPEADAIDLVRKVAGPGRIVEGHPAVAELAALCGCVPLALRIVAARLRHHRALSIEDIVAGLRNENARLDHLQDEERSLVAGFDLSRRHLTSPERRLFDLLALNPGLEADADAAAALADIDHRSAERLLDSLVDHNLLVRHAPGRYSFHDLIRLYAQG